MSHDFTGSPRTDRGPYQQVYSGKHIFPLDPRPEEIDVRDMAESLSKICRFIGHCKRPYFVADHCLLVARIVARHWRAWALDNMPHYVNSRYLKKLAITVALLHDGGEYCTNDITRPMKRAFSEVAPGVLQKIERDIDIAIAARFAISIEFWDAVHPLVKYADNVAVSTERRDLLNNTGDTDWGPLPNPLRRRIKPLSHTQARKAWLRRLRQLVGKRRMAAYQG